MKQPVSVGVAERRVIEESLDGENECDSGESDGKCGEKMLIARKGLHTSISRHIVLLRTTSI